MALSTEAKNSLEIHFGLRAAALQAHDAQLKAERGTGVHTAGRHGYQTGWESQLIRAVTGKTPDQDHDQTGVNPSIRRWAATPDAPTGITDRNFWHDIAAWIHIATPRRKNVGLNAAGARVAIDPALPEAPLNYETKPGKDAGSFFSPAIQQSALAAAVTKAGTLRGWDQALIKIGAHPEAWQDVTTLLIVTSGPPGGAGLTFSRRIRDNSYGTYSRESVVRDIDAFQRRVTWGEHEGYTAASLHMPRDMIAKVDKPRFDSMDSLLEKYQIDVEVQKNAVVILRRADTVSPYELVTGYPTNNPVGWAPGQHKPKGGTRWTGKMQKSSSPVIAGRRAWGKFPVPAW